jgi:hypothetical protein
MNNTAIPYPEFDDDLEPRYVALFPWALAPFGPPEEIMFARPVTEQTPAGASQAAADLAGSSRGDAIACERIAVNAAPWPNDVVPGCPAWLLRPGDWFVAVPYFPWNHSWNREYRTRGTTLRIRFASEHENEARRQLAACTVRALLGRVISIHLGDSGAPIAGIDKDGDRLQHFFKGR